MEERYILFKMGEMTEEEYWEDEEELSEGDAEDQIIEFAHMTLDMRLED